MSEREQIELSISVDHAFAQEAEKRRPLHLPINAYVLTDLTSDVRRGRDESNEQLLARAVQYYHALLPT